MLLSGRVSASLLMVGLAILPAAARVPRPSRCVDGTLRWVDDGSEVALFGVNLYAPFSIDYAALRRRGIDPADSLRADLVHLRRLGLDLLRLHCWDREISDPEGNLVDNDHLRLLDLLIAEASQHGLYMLLTPIAWWGGANPGSNGFSNRFTMPEMTTSAEALACQTRFLAQFVAHTNRFTGLRYAEDPRIVAFETINEPIYPSGTADAAVTRTIDAHVAAIRGTGCTKPVLFNCWGGREQAAAASTLDGVTFGWYPTGLVAGRALTHDCLPTVDRHHSAHTPCLGRMLKAVYEFDAADVPGSYMYPAMAREFRSAGVQLAAQFQYDAMALAGTNENWQTHHLSLTHTPGKAISFAIAAEAFRRIPRGTAFPKYPANCRFADVRLSFAEDLSELVTDTDFLYSNTTRTAPPAPHALRRIWGVGCSPVVDWAGTGAYFLDRLADGLWRLQVYPDAVVIADPYSGGSAEKVRLIPGTHRLCLRLPDLGAGFRCRQEGGVADAVAARDGGITLGPGSYLLLREGVGMVDVPAGVPFVLPTAAPTAAAPGVRLEVPDLWREGRPLPLTVTVAASMVASCTARFLVAGESAPRLLPLQSAGPYRFAGEVPAAWLVPGVARCAVDVALPEGRFRFPGGQAAGERPEVPTQRLWQHTAGAPLPPVTGSGWRRGEPTVTPVRGAAPHAVAIHVEADGFGDPPACVGVRLPVRPAETVPDPGALAVALRGGPETTQVEIALVQSDGSAYGSQVQLSTEWRAVRLPLASMRPMWSTKGGQADARLAAEVSLIFGAWLFPEARDSTHWVEIAEIMLAPEPEGVPIRVRPATAPAILVRPAAQTIRTMGRSATVAAVPGPGADTGAVRVSVPGFGPAPDCTSLRLGVLPGELDALGTLGSDPVLTLRLRAGRPDTDAVEVVLVEEDGSPWGAVVPLRGDWQELTLAAREFRFFAHWAHPEGRGGAGDLVRLDRVRHISFCFGAWLYGERAARPHAIEIGEVTAGVTP